MTATRPTYRIFLASTGVDLEEHRKHVSDAVLRLEQTPVVMETFGARPGDPVSVCQELARDADVLIVIVAHRYGWVPSVDDGGDGRKSITWLEVEAAKAAGRPVFAFLVNPGHTWAQPKEQDRLVDVAADPVKALEVARAVQGLKDLKDWLDGEARVVHDRFTTPEDLAAKATASLANWALEQERGGRSRAARPRRAEFRVAQPLQPAPHFHGRRALLEDLEAWWADPAHPDRVRALVAVGGTGKTAVAERFLHRVRGKPQRASTLVWSFYEVPHTPRFLAEASDLFLGVSHGSAGGRLERLQRGLADGSPHLLVLDGVERVQSPGRADRAWGQLEDHELRTLLRSVAGGLGRTRALVTSRYKLVDLAPWEGSGYRSYPLDDLDEEAAIGVLRAWGVRGTDETLDRLAADVGRHALSVSVLGSFLHEFRGGDPTAAPRLDLSDAAADDLRAAKLARILAEYAKALPDAERDLLARLSTFPRGVSVHVLAYLVDAGGEMAGALVGHDEIRLARLADRLTQRGLVFAYDRGPRTYSAHPFLRDYFRGLLGVPSTEVHEVVRAKLAPSLEQRPLQRAIEPAILDRYEELIEHTRLAGRTREAFALFWYGPGPYRHLGAQLGEYVRGARMLGAFSPDGDPGHAATDLAPRERSLLLTEWGLFSERLGELALARQCFVLDEAIARKLGDPMDIAIGLRNACRLAYLQGELWHALDFAERSVQAAEEANERDSRYFSRVRLGWAHHQLGDMVKARGEFSAAADLRVLGAQVDGALEARHCLDLGELDSAQARCEADLAFADPANRVRCYAVLGRISLRREIAAARSHVAELRDWTSKTGDVEMVLEAHLIAAEIARLSGDLQGALAEARTGLHLADGGGFGILAIQLLIVLARANLAIPDPRSALQHAREALDRSQRPSCGYAWGEADALHLCGLAHRGLGEIELATRRLQAAVTVRERIEHPGLEESRHALADLPPRS